MEGNTSEITKIESKPKITINVEDLPQIKPDFSKPPESILSTKSEVVTEPIQNIEGGVEKENKPFNPALENSKESKKPKNNPIRNLFNWWKNPPETDSNVIRDKFFSPAFTGTIISSTAISLSANETLFNYLVAHGQAGTLLFGSLALLIPSGTALLGSIMLRENMQKKEKSNRVQFSQLLTVSKAFITKASKLRPALRKVDESFNTGFIGELNFVGVDRKSWEGINSPLDTLRDGAKGLYNLAVACEQGDPTLQDINTFGGISHMLSPHFEKYGFKVFQEEQLSKKSITQKVFDFLDNFRETKRYPNGATQKDSLYYGIITRDNLIKHKAEFAKLGKLSLPA